MKRTRQFFCSIFVISFFLGISAVQAEIYKCTTDNGEVEYKETPCPIKDKEKKIQNEKDVVGGYTPSALKEKDKKSEPDKYQEISPESNLLEDVNKRGSKTQMLSSRLSSMSKSASSSSPQGSGKYVFKKSSQSKSTDKSKSNELTLQDKQKILGIHRIPQ